MVIVLSVGVLLLAHPILVVVTQIGIEPVAIVERIGDDIPSHSVGVLMS